uniref:Secreted protein n=1 Tax=Macrostomum lignano TaxID=282301 RepID=A0A1I8FSJ3_9PLAT
ASILAAAAVASGQTFNCTTNSTPTVVAVNSSRFSVRLSIDSTDSLCHILLVSSASSSGYFYVSLASTMESRYSRLRIQSDYPGSRVATIFSSSQSRYQSFATKSNRLYASLSRLFSSRSTVDSVLLNVHLVTRARTDGFSTRAAPALRSPTSDSSKCRCVHYTELSTALFHRQSCSTKQSYLCSCAVGGDSKFYSLFSEDEDKTSRAWIVGVVHFCFRYVGVAVGTKIKQKLTIRRSISAANGPRFSTTDVISNNLYPEPLAPPSYNYGGNCDEQPPSYNEAVSTGAAVPSAPTPEEIYGAGHFQQAANWK